MNNEDDDNKPRRMRTTMDFRFLRSENTGPVIDDIPFPGGYYSPSMLPPKRKNWFKRLIIKIRKLLPITDNTVK